MYEDDPTYEAECSRSRRPIDGECGEFHEWNAVCKFCKKPIDPKEAHLHMGSYVGECCWDERLRITE